MFLFRDRIHHSVVIIFSCFILSSISLAGLINFGLISHFLVYGNAVALIVTIAYGIRAGAIFVSVCLAIISIFAYLFINEIISTPVDLNVYASSQSAWSLVLFAGVVSNGLVIFSIGNMQKQLNKKIDELGLEKRKVEQLANQDSLTGLASVRLSNERIEMAIDRAKHSKNKVALLFIDLDGFKYINDRHGHDAGDHVLIEIANRLSNEVRNSDTICRAGGDEFLIVLPEIHKVNEVEKLCIRLLKEIERPIDYEENNLTVSASMGISIYPDDTSDLKSLRKLADTAMYNVKQSGKGNYKFVSNYIS